MKRPFEVGDRVRVYGWEHKYGSSWGAEENDEGLDTHEALLLGQREIEA